MIETLLAEYADVLQSTDDLPPLRAVDHQIQLKEGEPPVNVRLYRYAHTQKAEIETMIADMLQKGIIQPKY